MNAEMRLYGTVKLQNDLTAMADLLADTGDKGRRAVTHILQQAAIPVLERMQENARTLVNVRSGNLLKSIKIGRVLRGNGGYRIRVGIQRGTEGANYATPLEFGHGGPHGPAAPHPIVLPAFDATNQEAYETVKRMLAEALQARGL